MIIDLKELRRITRVSEKQRKRERVVREKYLREDKSENRTQKFKRGRDYARNYLMENSEILKERILEAAQSGKYEIKLEEFNIKTDSWNEVVCPLEIGLLKGVYDWADQNGFYVRTGSSISCQSVYISWKPSLV